MTISLKPQDVVILLKFCEYNSTRPPYSVIADEVKISQAEVLNAVKRLRLSHLLEGKSANDRPILDSVEEFLIHGVKYAFPPKRGTIVRGIPTSYAADPLKSLIIPGDDPIPVWPYSKGDHRGLALLPLYRTVPEAVQNDRLLYQRLALTDAIRSGNSRERKLAESELIKSLRHGA